MPLRAITFDCWNTLLRESNWPKAHALRVAALQHAARDAGREVDTPAATTAFDKAWAHHMELWRDGVASGAREVAAWSLEALALEPGGAAIETLVGEFEEASHSGEVVEVDGAFRVLEAARERGLRLGLICDTGLTPGRVVRKHLERLGHLKHLAVTVFSDEWHRCKPDPVVFEAALRTLDCEARDAIHVGDLRHTDVSGARNAGMGSVRIRASHDDRGADPDADWVVDSHAELAQLIAEQSAS